MYFRNARIQYVLRQMNQNGSDNKAIALVLDDRGSIHGRGRNFLFVTTSGPALGPSRPHI
jgi:hypothetical protein